MSANYRTVFERTYRERSLFFPFLSTFFTAGPEDISDASTMIIEVKRANAGYIAPVIMDNTQQGQLLKNSKYTSKEFTPPLTALGASFGANDLITKQFGKTVFDSANESYIMQLINMVQDVFIDIENRFNYQIEYQASQILQTGTVTLYDENGIAAWTISFQPKATHFPTVGTSWSDDDSDPDADIQALSKVIRTDGQVGIRNLIFGETALENYLKNNKTVDKFDVLRIQSGIYDPQAQNEDVDLLGDLLIGTKRYRCWLYSGTYKSPVALAGTETPFVGADKVIFLPGAGSVNFDFRRKTLTVPSLVGVDERVNSIIPGNIFTGNRAYTVKAFLNKKADALEIELKNKQMLIPVSIDAFGCLDTEI